MKFIKAKDPKVTAFGIGLYRNQKAFTIFKCKWALLLFFGPHCFGIGEHA